MSKAKLSDSRSLDIKSILTNLLLLSFGLVLTMSGTYAFRQSVLLSNIAIGLGVGLLGTAVAGFLTDWIIAPHSTKVLEEAIARTMGTPALILPKRTLLTEMYRSMVVEAREVDLTSLTLKAFFNGFSIQEIVGYIKQGKHFRIMVLLPGAPVTRIREKEEKAADFTAAIQESLRIVESIYRSWERGDKREWRGSFEVRLYDSIPCFAFFRADSRFIIGYYYHHSVGLHSECVLIKTESVLEHDIAANMREHFRILWRDNEDHVVCRISKRQSFFGDEHLIMK